jgi:DNA (cytosine-5)-methyltransferase 1
MILLDLFCGGGGAGEGYQRTGFDVVGIDISDHEKSFSRVGQFFQMDWKDGLDKFLSIADVIHASPPCQRYSQLTKWGRKDRVETHPDLLEPVREALIKSDKPYIIENVPRAPLINPIMLCGWTFGYEIYRHRLFETNMPLVAPEHRKHEAKSSSPGHWKEGTFISVAGHFAPAKLARQVMDIDWMSNSELSESIPPYFTEHLGRQVYDYLK